MALNFDTLRKLAAEAAQCVGAFVQEVRMLSETRMAVGLYSGLLNWFVFDFSPAAPFFVCVRGEAGLRKVQKRLPLSNFLAAHFKGARLRSVLLAAPPDRTLHFDFESTDDAGCQIRFRCVPHGSEIQVAAGGKHVRLGVHQDAPVSFELLEATTDWTESDRFWSEVLGAREGASALPTQAVLKKNPFELKIAKLKKALAMIEKELDGGGEPRQRISELQAEALKIQNKVPVDGTRLNSVFAKIKSEKRKSEILAKRKGALLAEVAELEMKAVDESQNPEPKQARKNAESSQREGGFRGLRIQVEAPWEFWVGRNAQQNDELLRRASSEDIWLHLRDYPGAHGLLRGPKKQDPPLALVQFAARVVAGFSAKRGKPWSTGERLDFFVVKRKFLKKKRGAAPGEVVVDRETVRTVAYHEEKFQIISPPA